MLQLCGFYLYRFDAALVECCQLNAQKLPGAAKCLQVSFEARQSLMKGVAQSTLTAAPYLK